MNKIQYQRHDDIAILADVDVDKAKPEYAAGLRLFLIMLTINMSVS